ncbi:MAG: hypothetical protein DWQ01_08130 [Planctomycetota bacterium]|nr:MAG: hypothetical protein DWQ01_08130 [Planctomycetota bacterium]
MVPLPSLSIRSESGKNGGRISVGLLMLFAWGAPSCSSGTNQVSAFDPDDPRRGQLTDSRREDPASARKPSANLEGGQIWLQGAVPSPFSGSVPVSDTEFVDQQTKAGLQWLRARSVESSLGSMAQLAVPAGPHSIGATVTLKFLLANRFPRELEVLSPPEGMMVEIHWVLRKWNPYGGVEVLERTAVARMEGPFALAPGESLEESTSFALEPQGGSANLWEVRLQAQIRCDGVRMGEHELPVQQIRFEPVLFPALPPGWEDLQERPLERLAQALALATPQVDPHLLPCLVLAPENSRNEAMAMLMEALRQAPAEHRVAAICTGLRWLSGETMGNEPAAWQEWWGRRTMPR